MNSTTSTPPPAGAIVVGVDGSPSADLALEWAVRQAELEHRPLTIVYAAHISSGREGLWAGVGSIDVLALRDSMLFAGRELLENAVRRAGRLAPGVEVHRLLTSADPRQELLDQAERAALVVVGSRGRGPLATLLLGSVSVEVSKKAACPVVVIRHDRSTPTPGGVLVETDGTAHSLAALEFAYATASLRALPLTAIHVSPDDEPGAGRRRLAVAESVAGMHEKFPDVADRTVLVRGARDSELIVASRGMDLLVVGVHRGGLLGPLPGFGVAASVVEHASCDVAVVPSSAPSSPDRP